MKKSKETINLIVMLLGMMCLTTKAATASSDSLTVDEMKAMFYQRYINGVRPKSLDEYDLLKRDTHTKDSMYFCYLVNNEVLKNPKGIRLPVSEYVFYRDTLCWVKPRQGMPGKEFEQLAQKLQKKYGRIHVNDTLTVVPAKWMTGSITFISDFPEEYATTVFSSMAYRKEVINGVVKDYNDISMDLGHSQLQMELGFIVRGDNGYTPNGGHMIRFYDRFNIPREKVMSGRRLNYKRLLMLFARDLNHVCCNAPEGYDYGHLKCYSLLFYFDAQQRVHVEVLLPKQLDEMDRFLLSDLQKAVESQPAELFGSHFTIDGKIFPGLYVKATYGGFKWNLFDYRTIEEK
jgi:hypothetical protein